MITFLAAILTGGLGAYFATRRGRNPYVWFSLGFFFGILGAFAIFFAPKKKGVVKKTAEPRGIQGPLDKFWYYVNSANERVGPMSLVALNATWHQGEISEATLVWHEDLPEWKRLGELTSSP